MKMMTKSFLSFLRFSFYYVIVVWHVCFFFHFGSNSSRRLAAGVILIIFRSQKNQMWTWHARNTHTHTYVVHIHTHKRVKWGRYSCFLSLSLLCEPTENQKVVVEEDEEGFFDTIVTENKKRNDIYISISSDVTDDKRIEGEYIRIALQCTH